MAAVPKSRVRGVEKVLARLEAAKDVGPIKQAVLAGALMVETTAKESIAHGAPSGRVYKRGNVTHQASAPGQPPASDTGVLLSSINHWESNDGLTVSVGSRLERAAHLEYGTRNMAARPWLHPALDINRPAIIERIRKAILEKRK